METKFDIGETVYVKATVSHIAVQENGTESYEISDPHFSGIYRFKKDELKSFQEVIRDEKDSVYGVDNKLRMAWEALSDIPVDDDGNLEEPFCPIPLFTKGTNREEIWAWFDALYSGGVAELMYQK